jgi:glutaredoxin 2
MGLARPLDRAHCLICLLDQSIQLGAVIRKNRGADSERLAPASRNAALDHYNQRKRAAIGDFIELRAHARSYISALMPDLEELDQLIESSAAINGKLSLDNIRVLPLLRSAAVVKGLRFPKKVCDYFETMMSYIGYAPLPAA